MKQNKQDAFRPYVPFLIIVAAAVGLYFLFNFWNQSPVETITYDQFLKSLNDNKIKSVSIDPTNYKIVGEFTDDTGKKNFDVVVYPGLVERITKDLETRAIKVQFEAPSENFFLILLTNIGPFLLILVFWFFMMRSMQGSGNQVFNFGKSKARLFLDDRPRITFKDVAGIPEVKEELKEVIDFLREPKRFTAMGAKVPRGVLLVGPPGCGKTYISRAVAGEAKVPFFSVSGSEFVEMFVGVGASRVRDLFDQAKRYAPALIFIDEIDAVGRQRGAGLGGGHDEREQTLNQLLVEMDGFEPNAGVIIIAATNRPDILDTALLRPGRFDRRVVIDMPTQMEREAILKYHGKNKPMAEDVDLATVGKRTAGFSGADLENLLNEAAIIATRRQKKRIEHDDIEEAIDRVIAGPQKKTRVLGSVEKQKVAYHEAGHALIMHVLGPEPVHRISIVSRGMALGYTTPLPTEDKYLRTEKDLVNTISGLMGGMCAEKLVFNEISTGASNDIRRATDIAKKMVMEFGMSKLGPIAFGNPPETVFLGRDFMGQADHSEETGKLIDAEVRRIVNEAASKSEHVLEKYRPVLDELVEKLMLTETLDEGKLAEVLSKIQ
jgi:cell division protease FtsH